MTVVANAKLGVLSGDDVPALSPVLIANVVDSVADGLDQFGDVVDGLGARLEFLSPVLVTLTLHVVCGAVK